MTHADPTTFSITDTRRDDSTFQDMVAEQLRHTPWLALSIAAHAMAILLMWILIPAEPEPKVRNQTAMVDTTTEQVQPPEPPKPIETKPEEIEIDPVLPEENVIENSEPVDVAAPIDSQSVDTFTSESFQSPCGLGPGRSGPYRSRGGRQPGRGARLDSTKDNALKWLSRHQDADGRWDCDGFMKHDTEGEVCDGAGNAVHDVGVTGLALLAFLGDNNTMRAGPYRDVVKKGVRWLREQQQDNGLFGTNTSHDFIYDHAIATYAMCEAYGLSNYTTLRPLAQKAINYLESHRSPYGVWSYQPQVSRSDTSITGWAIMALESGKFFGLQVNDNTLHLCSLWLDQVSDPTGRHGYTTAGEQSSRKRGNHAARFPVDKGESLTAVGLFCRFFMGQDPKEKPVMKAAAELIGSTPPLWNADDGSIDHYYWYYATYALFQTGGKHWKKWQRRLAPAVIKTQHTDANRPNLHGSWDPVGAWGEDGGRVYSTAILALTAQAHYRYCRLLR